MKGNKMENCIFCKIANGEIKSEFVYESKNTFVIKDLNPKAKTHLLLIPKEHFENLNAIENTQLAGEILETIHNVTRKLGIEDNYRIQINNGKGAGQEVFHLHIHILSNK